MSPAVFAISFFFAELHSSKGSMYEQTLSDSWLNASDKLLSM
jgi:hypothetical protein